MVATCHSQTACWQPEGDALISLQQALQHAFPECKDLSQEPSRGIQEFVPHLSLGQWRNADMARQAGQARAMTHLLAQSRMQPIFPDMVLDSWAVSQDHLGEACLVCHALFMKPAHVVTMRSFGFRCHDLVEASVACRGVLHQMATCATHDVMIQSYFHFRMCISVVGIKH